MKAKRRKDNIQQRQLRWRSSLVLAVFTIVATVLLARAVQLQIFNNEFLTEQGDARYLRTAKIAAHRGMILDRYGEPLAVSTPVDTIWANPQELLGVSTQLPVLAQALGLDTATLTRRLESRKDREFIYLRRHMPPDEAAKVRTLQTPGVHVLREYRRYYPAGEVTAHVLGFTDPDDKGLEGLELAYDHWLAGTFGAKRVLKDRLGRTVEDVENVKSPRPGRTLTTTLDLRIQYLAYRELKAAIQQRNARSGSVVVVEVDTGEVLAIVNQPSYNPNDRSQYPVANYRNRAVTDIFEPGSSFKPMVIAAALESGRVQPSTLVDTTPGVTQVGSWQVKDPRNFGVIDVTRILAKSSNVGAAKLALTLEPEQVWNVLYRFGIGQLSDSGFPGESAGSLSHYEHWRPIAQATLSYGYGLTLTALQLTQAYAAIGAGGLRANVAFVRQENPPPPARVVTPHTAQALLKMLETVVTPEGTGAQAGVRGYRVAGKTGTARKAELGGYSDDRHIAVFAGIAPATRPRIAITVVIDEPASEQYHGGDVAAPVFSRIMGGSLRLLGVPPDDLTQAIEAPVMQTAARP